MLKVTRTEKRLYGGDVRKTVQYFDTTIQRKIRETSEIEEIKKVFSCFGFYLFVQVSDKGSVISYVLVSTFLDYLLMFLFF